MPRRWISSGFGSASGTGVSLTQKNFSKFSSIFFSQNSYVHLVTFPMVREIQNFGNLTSGDPSETY